MKSSNKNKLLLLPVAVIVLLLGVLSANATIDCNITSVSTINKNSILNATFNTSTVWDTVAVAFELRDTTRHINSSYSVIRNTTNTSNQKHANLTFSDDIVFPDADSADLRVTCYATGGGLNVSTSSAVTGITVDRSNANINGVSVAGSNVGSNLYTVTFGFSNTSLWRVFHNGLVVQTTSVTSDLTNTSGSQQISLRDSGSYYVEVSDGLNVTNSATVSYTLAGGLIKSSIIKTTEVVKQQEVKKIIKQKESNKNLLLIGVGFVMFIVIVGIIMTPKIKRRR